MAKKPKIRFSGYFPESIIQAIKDKAEKEGLSENDAATKLLELGMRADAHKPGSYQTDAIIISKTDPP